ncbi:RDD family protein [Roseateles terrae]|uniref:RDD family membrane protein YckC n=1 Tax=Roseateles terrae TaxID=431060 RepID=A0ABR6GT92_9BURK|nr:RDD family protein [Roseateles terrae]MBB3195322.1 putative RDD family membrane protein YckC [Roseateles terrae]
MSGNTDQRFAAPEAFVEDVGTSGGVLAGRGVRLVAALLDGVLLGGIVFGLMAASPTISRLLSPENPSYFAVHWSGLLIGLPLFLLVQGWTLVSRGQTLAKIVFGLRIVRTDGSKVDPFRILGLRYGVGYLTAITTGTQMLYGLIDALLIFRESRQCLHDTIADTKVIKL